jgi:hypothetical protein
MSVVCLIQVMRKPNLRIKRRRQPCTRCCPSTSRRLRDSLQLHTRIVTVAHARYNRQTALECRPHEIISSALAHYVLHVHAAALPNSVRTILRLQHDAWSPMQLCKHDGCGSSERDPGAHGRDAQESDSDAVLLLKVIDHLRALAGIRASIDTHISTSANVANSFHSGLHCIQDLQMMREYQHFCPFFYYVRQKFNNSGYLGTASGSDHLIESLLMESASLGILFSGPRQRLHAEEGSSYFSARCCWNVDEYLLPLLVGELGQHILL